MIDPNAPVDPSVHLAARLIAKRFTAMVGSVLRDEEKGDAEREGYLIARNVLEQLRLSKGE